MKLSGSDKDYHLLGWANDWLLLDLGETDKDGGIKLSPVSPARAVLTADEVAKLAKDYEDAQAKWLDGKTHHAGQFWKDWRLVDAGPVGFLEPR